MFPLHGRVPVVLNGIIRTPWEVLCNLRPLVPQFLVQLHDFLILLLRKAGLVDIRGQVVVPALTALLPDAVPKLAGDESPALGAVLVQEGDKTLVLLPRPWAFGDLARRRAAR